MENLFSLWLKLTLKSERRFFAHMFCLLSLERVCVCVCVCWVYAGMTKINQKSPTPTLFFFLLNDVYTLLLRPSDIIYHYLSSMKNERKCEVKKYLETRNQFSQLKIQSTSWQFFLTVCQISHVGKILMITLFLTYSFPSLASLWKIFTISLRDESSFSSVVFEFKCKPLPPSSQIILYTTRSVWCFSRKWTFAGGEVDLGIRYLLFSTKRLSIIKKIIYIHMRKGDVCAMSTCGWEN